MANFAECLVGTPKATNDHLDPSPVVAAPQQLCMLIVDDDSYVRASLRACLEHAGFRVWTAGNGQDAVDLYRRHHPIIQLVLLDVQMPVLDGPETLKQLRTINPKVRSCFMSGGLGSYEVEDLLRLGAALVLSKPFNAMERTAIFRQMLSTAECPAS